MPSFWLIFTSVWYYLPNLVIQPNCEYKGVKYNCGLSLACTLAGGVTKDLCNGGPLWQCCVPKSADNENTVQTPVFSLNDASKLSSTLPFRLDEEENESTKQLTWLSDQPSKPNYSALGLYRLSSWIAYRMSIIIVNYNNFSQCIGHRPWPHAVFFS